MDLSELTYDTFAGRVGETFRDSAAGTTLELVEANDLAELTRGRPDAPRAPFSLVFRGPSEPLVEQSIRTLVHDGLGELEIFLVPIAREADGLRYEAVFS